MASTPCRPWKLRETTAAEPISSRSLSPKRNASSCGRSTPQTVLPPESRPPMAWCASALLTERPTETLLSLNRIRLT